jgi:hypothetical protein
MEYGINVFFESDILLQLAKHSGKVAAHFKAEGVIAHPEKADEVWEFYLGKIPQTVLSVLMQENEAYVIFDTNEAALNAYDEWFPLKEYLLDDEMYFFVKGEFVSSDETMNISND